MEWIRSFFILFVLLVLLVSLVSGSHFEKYIRFFSEVILAFAFLSPVLSIICDSDTFLEKIQYEAFTESLSELSQDAAKVEFVQNDYYIRKYELAIAEDVRQIAAAEGFVVEEASVRLTKGYELEEISLTISGISTDKITVDKVNIGEVGAKDSFVRLKERLAEYYQIEEARITICQT